MATLSSNPSSVVSAGTWTGGANVYLSDNVFATNTGATQNTEYPLEVGGFNFTGIPAGSTIDSVTVTMEAKTGTAARAQIKGELLDGSTVLGTRALANLTAADANYTFTPTATLAQLQSANLKVRVTNKRIVSQASTTSVDWVKIDVVYTAPPPTAVTQAAYRFYADGTETGATALANQDTAPTVDVASGDVNLGLRMRLQETGSGAVPATDDFRLQWEKNASGTWTNVDVPVAGTVDSYTNTSGSGTYSMAVATSGYFSTVAQSFLGDGGKLVTTTFRLASQNAAAATGTVKAELYAHTGTFGTNSQPTGTALATSTTVINCTAISGTASWVQFDFDGTFTLASGTPYCIACTTTNTSSSGYPLVSINTAAPVAAGNQSRQGSTGTWFTTGGSDVLFEITRPAVVATTAIGYDSPNLTDAGATTNRLGAGSGSFVAGKVSEDGLVDDVGWSASNYTELLYSLTLKQADLANGNTLRFRVLKNGATTDLTYTSYPSITIGAGGPATIQATVALVAASTLTATAVPERAAAVTLAAASTLTVAGVPARVASVALSAVSTLTAAGTVTAPAPEIAATAALTAASTLTATAVRIPQATVSLTATSTLTAPATRFGVLLATVPLAAAGTLTATGVREPQASVGLTATSTLTATGIRTQDATAALVGASELTTGAVVARVPVVALSAVSTLTATAVREPQATVSLVASSTLTATAMTTPAVFGTVALAAVSTLTATAVREPQATVSLVAGSTLTATAVRVVVVGGAAVPYLTEVLTDTPSVLWLCNETAGAATAADSSGNGKTGTPGANVTFGAAGLVTGYPTAAAFAGSSGVANLLQVALTPLADGAAYSLETWIRTTAAGTRYVTGDMGTTAGTARGTLTVDTTGNASASIRNTASAQFEALSTTPIRDGAPHHLVATVGGGFLRLYVDGTAAASIAVTGNCRALQSLRCGGSTTGTFPFQGTQAGAAFYPTALTPERVAAHYVAGTGAGAGAGVPLSAVSTLTASAITFGATGGAAVLTASSTLTATGVRTQQTTAALSAVSTLTATATTSAAPVVTATVALSASSTLTATAVRQPQATVSLTATAVLTVTGVRVRVVAVSLTASSTLTATPTRVRPATVPLTAAATLTVQLVRIPQAFVGMTGTSVLVVTTTVTAAPTGIPNAAHTGFLHALDTDLTWYPVTVPS